VNGENIMEENESKIMDLVDSTDPILTSWAEDFDFDNPPADPVFAMEGEPARVCFNPRIVSTSGDDILLEEGCLSYPGLIVKVKRPQHARIRFTGPNGETFTEQFTGMTARVIQHEMDHLEGILFFDKANRYHREQAFKNWKKWKKVGILNDG
jgi:peptide deformylase